MKRHKKSANGKKKSSNKNDLVFHVSNQELDHLDKRQKERVGPSKSASRSSRAWATLIDLFLCVPTYFVIAKFPGVLGLVNLYLLSRRGQTIGKYFMKIQILQFGTGEIADWTNLLLLRPLLPFLFFVFLLITLSSNQKYYALIPCLLFCIDCSFIIRSDRRCLHDLMAGTSVFEYDPKKYVK